MRDDDPINGLTAFMQAAPDGMVAVDPAGCIRAANGPACDMFGYRRDDLLGQKVEVLVPEGLRAAHVGHRERFERNPHTRPMGAGIELVARRSDGTEFPTEISLSSVDTAGSRLTLAAVRNVTQRRAMEAATREAISALAEAQAIAHVGSWSWEPRSDTATWSDEMYRIFGRDPASGPATSEAFFAYVHPDDRERVASGYRQTFGGGGSFALDYRIIRPDGEQRVVHALGRRDDARPAAYIGTVQDVTALRATEHRLRTSEQALRDHEQLLKDAQELAHVGSWEWDVSGERVMLSDELCRILGRPVGSRPTRDQFLGVIHPDDRDLVSADGVMAPTASTIDRDYRIVRPDGTVREVHGRRYGHVDEQGRVTRLFGTIQDITERKRHELKLQRLATHDPLTGLANRRMFDERLHDEMARAVRDPAPISVVLFDIDHFKAINDEHGHPTGDRVLAEIAGRLREHVRDGELLARLGGEEFGWILPGARRDGAFRAAERARRAVADTPIEGIGVTVSGGVATADRPEGLKALYRHADQALYQAKERGRNQTIRHTHGASQAA